MKKIIYLLGIGLLTQCTMEPFEQPNDYYDSNNVELQTSQTRSMERINDSLFVVEYGKRYSVDPNVITVKYKHELEKSSAKISKIRSNRLGYIDIQVPEGADIEEYVHELEKSGEFTSVEYNTYGEWCYSPNDTRVSEQWYLNTINAYSAWDIIAGSSSVKVAILDSGVDVNHPDLGAGTDGYSNVDVSSGWNFITNSSNVITINNHGTRVAGIVAAKTNNNGRGIAGVAGGKGNRGITMIPYCVGVNNPNSSVVDDAIYDAVSKGARVIQLSLGVGSASAITSAINYATQNNVVVVCSSGNDHASTVSYPASLSNVIAVGATTNSNVRANFSNYGTALDVVAPGVDILSTTLNSGYNSEDGTSFAAPQVSAIAALLFSAYPNLTGSQVETYIMQSANGYPYRNSEYGYGLVNAYKALTAPLSPSGQERPMLNTNNNSSYTYTYTRPSSLPSGVTFNGWNTHSSFYTVVSGGGTGTSITIKFPNLGNFVLTTQYTINGTSYSFNKDLTPYYYPYFSEISPNCFRASADIPNVTFEWEILNGAGYFSNGTTRTSNPVYVSAYGNGSFTLRCRAVQGGYNYSDWYEQIIY